MQIVQLGWTNKTSSQLCRSIFWHHYANLWQINLLSIPIDNQSRSNGMEILDANFSHWRVPARLVRLRIHFVVSRQRLQVGSIDNVPAKTNQTKHGPIEFWLAISLNSFLSSALLRLTWIPRNFSYCSLLAVWHHSVCDKDHPIWFAPSILPSIVLFLVP